MHKFAILLIAILCLFAASADAFPPRGGGSTAATGCGTGGVCAQSQNGQTFVTWNDLATGAAGAAYRYKLYESASPITSGNYTSATLVGQGLPNNSAQLIGDCPDHVGGWAYTQANRQTAPTALGTTSCQGQMMQLSMGGAALPAYSGLWARTIPSNRSEYYAVVGNNGSDTYIGSVGPVVETTTAPQPIQILASNSRVADPTGSTGGIPGAAAGLGMEFQMHASNPGGGATQSLPNTLGDYFVFFGTPTDGYQDGIPFVSSAYRLHTRSPQILQGDWRETWWWPDYGAGATNSVESDHRYLGVIPSAQTQAAYGSDTSAHMYPFAIKRLASVFDFYRAHYGASIGLATDNWACVGESMGSWGCSQFVLKEYPLSYFASAFVSKGPLFQQYNDLSSAGENWPNVCGAVLFSAGTCPNPMGTNAAAITLPNGTTPWGGSGGQVDLVSQVQNATVDLTPFFWGIGKHDQFASWPVVLSAASAFESSDQCHGFAWNDMGHNEGGSPLDALWKERGAATGGTTGKSYGYSEFGFKTDQATLCFSSSSINDNPGTGVTTGGEYDGDVVGCEDCGFNNLTVVSDTSTALEYTFGNAFMGNAATTIPTTTLAADMTASQTTMTLTSAAALSCPNGTPYLRIGTGSTVEIVGCTSVASNIVTITRAQYGTTAHTHNGSSSPETVVVLPLEPTGPNAGPQTTLTVNVKPRQMQHFKPTPGSVLSCTSTPNAGSPTTTSPTVDSTGHWETTGVVVNSSGTTDYVCTNPAPVIATRTMQNISGSTISGVPLQIGQVFARGDVPGCLTTHTPIPQDHTGADLNYQIDETSTWDDGSCEDLVYTLILPTIANNATEQFKFVSLASAYTPGTDTGSTADITSGHDFQMVLTDVRDHTATTIGSGDFTFDVNTCIADGTTWVYATGPYRHGVGVACTAPDTTGANVQTTINQVGGISNSATGNMTVNTIPAGCSSDTTANQIVKIDHEYILAKYVNSTTLNLTTRAAVRSTAASHSNGATITCEGNLYAQFYFDIYRNAGGSIYTIGHMPMVMLPWENVAAPDFESYFADYNDNGVGDVRNWAYQISGIVQSTAVTVGTGSGNEPGKHGSINFGDTTLRRSECVSFSSSGTLPGGISANTPYWVRPTTFPTVGGTYQLFTNAQGPSNSSNTSAVATVVPITSTGSGNLTVTRRLCQPYRIAWTSPANDAGQENFTANAATMDGVYDDLTSAEKQYWVKSGLVPPLDTSLTPNTPSATPSLADSVLARPLIAVNTVNTIGAAGESQSQGAMPEWDAFAFLKQDQTSWDYARAAAVESVGMPYVGTLEEASGRIVPLNGGASRFNTSCVDSGANSPYSLLGANEPNFQYSANHVNAVTTPASGAPDFASGTGSLSDGVWNISGGDGMGPSQGHWPLFPHLLYAFTGREWLLDSMFMMADNALMVRQVPAASISFGKNKQSQPLGTGTIYYGIFPFGADRTDHTIGNVALALTSGSATTHQEKVYIKDDLQENECYMSAAIGNFAAGQTNLGMWDLDTAGSDGLTTWWSGYGFAWTYIATRRTEWQTVASTFANNMITRWGEGTNGWSSFWGPPEYIANFVAPQNALLTSGSNWNSNFKPNFATSLADIGFTVASGNGGGPTTMTAASPSVFTTVLYSDFNLANGDEVKCLGTTYNGGTPPGSAYTGPPECEPLNNPSANAEWFFVCNLTTSGSGTTINYIYNIGTDATCATLIGLAASHSSQTVAFHPEHSVPVGNCVVTSFACTNWDPAGDAAENRAQVNWYASLGLISPSAPAVTNVNARVTIPTADYQSAPQYDYTVQTIQ